MTPEHQLVEHNKTTRKVINAWLEGKITLERAREVLDAMEADKRLLDLQKLGNKLG